MAKVTIINYTGIGWMDGWGDDYPREYAARLLAFTKNTRLNMSPEGFQAFLDKPWSEIKTEIDYMATTIPSALEFVDVTFMLENVSRACAQQITRTRNASYQMASQRVVDMSKATYHIPETVKDVPNYAHKMRKGLEDYEYAIKHGESMEDARGLLPMNIHCNLVAKYNLRSLVDLLRARDSLRVQGEYRDIAAQMKAAVLDIWPWSEVFFRPKNEQAIKLIEEVANQLRDSALLIDPKDKELVTRLAKAADILKKA